MSFGEAYSDLYDAFYADKDYEGEADYVLRIIRENFPSGRLKVLELGIGTGKHAQLMASSDTNLEVTGIEPSPYMAKQAKQRGFSIIEGRAPDSMRDLPSNHFDVLLALFHVVSYLIDESDLDALFREVDRCLTPNGIFIFDVWHAEAVLHQGMRVTEKTATSRSGERLVRIGYPSLDAANNVGTVTFKIFAGSSSTPISSEPHTLRYFRKEEVVKIASRYGLQLVESHEFLSRMRPSKSTWGVTYIVRKARGSTGDDSDG